MKIETLGCLTSACTLRYPCRDGRQQGAGQEQTYKCDSPLLHRRYLPYADGVAVIGMARPVSYSACRSASTLAARALRGSKCVDRPQTAIHSFGPYAAEEPAA